MCHFELEGNVLFIIETRPAHEGFHQQCNVSRLSLLRRSYPACEKLKSILYQGREKEEVGIPSTTVKKIDDRVFWGCKLLVRLGLNEGLERIGRYAFYHCESLTRMEIPSTVNVIDQQAFQDCRRLARLGLNEGLDCACIRQEVWTIITTRTHLWSVVMTDPITSILCYCTERRRMTIFPLLPGQCDRC
eukprot:scaffold6894_cov73-Cylindrotheca_fusiformis.AAC.1